MSANERIGSTQTEHFGDNFILVVPVDYLEHTSEHPFCGDPACQCSEDPDNIAQVNQAYQDGLITANDATRIVQGRTV